MDPRRELIKKLADERRLLDRLRADYAAIRRSRFHALRLFWFALKALFGLSKPTDVYAAWSGVEMGTGLPLNTQALFGATSASSDLEDAVKKLVASWKALVQARPPSPEPMVSVVMPVYNNAAVTVRCLQSVIDQWPQTLPCQLIVVDDESTDSTPEIMAQLPGMDYLRNAVNAGFIRTCNRGSEIARGKFICFLNNDTIVQPAWLDELVITMDTDPTIGAVGSKLVYPDGRLQEAGGVIWSDGDGWNYGRGADPNDPRFSYLRDVDYCSGAALLVRADLFRKLGGFSEFYIPAYYEDTDLCFAIRQLGFRVVYQPLSVVIHDEGTSSGTSVESGIKRYQAINKPKFLGKWRDALAVHEEHDAQRIHAAARRLLHSKTILIIDNYVSEFDKDSGSRRMFNLIRQFQKNGVNVIFVPDNYFRSEPYTSVFQRMGVEVLYRTDESSDKFQAVRDRLSLVDIAWVCRPDIAANWLPVLRERPDLPIIYDTLDLHYVRVKRELELKKITDPAAWDKWRAERAAELHVIREADVAIAITETERQTLAEEGVTDAFVVPNVHTVVERALPFDATNGLLFIGGYQHPPNVDAALWLANEIMPLIWAENSEIALTLLGSSPPESVRNLQSERISVPGYIYDVSRYFEQARVFVAPLRYGAGLKGKVGQAFEFGVPTVTTMIGAEGFGIVDGEDALLASDAPAFAKAVLRVYADQALWTRLSAGATRRIAQFSPEATAERLRALVARIEKGRVALK